MGIVDCLPEDWRDAVLLGRMDFGAGPTPVLVRGGRVEDVSAIAPTTADLLNAYADNALIPRGLDKGPLDAFDLRAVWEAPENAAVKLLSQRTFDILRVIQLLNSAGHKEIHLAGKGWGALPAAFAAVLSPSVTQVTLKNALTSFHDLAIHEDHQWPAAVMLPNVLSQDRKSVV